MGGPFAWRADAPGRIPKIFEPGEPTPTPPHARAAPWLLPALSHTDDAEWDPPHPTPQALQFHFAVRLRSARAVSGLRDDATQSA